jgi:hypothetical protein
MRQIYQNSIRVVVWLGDQFEDSHLAFKLILDLQQTSIWHEVDENRALVPETMREVGLPVPDSQQWKALGSLMSMQWFSRIWIIQELAVSRDALVVCGDLCVSWDELATAARCIQKSALSTITMVDQRSPIRLEIFRLTYIALRDEQPILPILLKGRSSFATDHRDKIFALLGLSAQASEPPFFPNYFISTEIVYTDFARQHIEDTMTLDILGAVEDHSYRLKKQLPSWVPDWEVHPPATPFITLEQYSLWNACEGSDQPISVHFRDDNKILLVKGLTLDIVRHIGDAFLEFVPLPGTTHNLMPHLKSKLTKKMM